VRTIGVLPEAERRQLVEEWNRTEAEYSKEKRIHDLFEEQVERSPEAIAAVDEDEQVGYYGLNSRSNRLAHPLRGLGVGPEVRVGLYLERSLGMVVGLLGVLKAGGAYLPLDLAYPSERLAYMLEDAQVPVLLSEQRLRESLLGQDRLVVYLD